METTQLLYWHWIILGMLLCGLEMLLASFMLLWFGVAAILVGVVLWLVPSLALSWQLLLWLLDAALLIFAWFRYIQPRFADKTHAGMGRESLLGETGMVIRAPRDGLRGRLRFSTPILGADEWDFITDETVAEGDRIRVKEVSGNALVVSKKS